MRDLARYWRPTVSASRTLRGHNRDVMIFRNDIVHHGVSLIFQCIILMGNSELRFHFI